MYSFRHFFLNSAVVLRFVSFSFPLFREGRGMLPLFCGLLGPNPVLLMGEGQGTPWMSRQLIAGP